MTELLLCTGANGSYLPPPSVPLRVCVGAIPPGASRATSTAPGNGGPSTAIRSSPLDAPSGRRTARRSSDVDARRIGCVQKRPDDGQALPGYQLGPWRTAEPPMTLHILPATVRGAPAGLVVVMSGDGFKVHPMAMRDPAGALALLRVMERRETAPSPAEFAGHSCLLEWEARQGVSPSQYRQEDSSSAAGLMRAWPPAVVAGGASLATQARRAAARRAHPSARDGLDLQSGTRCC